MILKLPRYTVAKNRGKYVDFYFVVPKKLRPKDWKPSITLPRDMQKAFGHADTLNKRLDAQRQGRALKTFPPGSMPLIIRHYQQHADWKALAPDTRRLYSQTIRHIEAWSEKAGHPHVNMLNRPIINKFLDKFAATPTLRKKVGGMIRLLCERAIATGDLTHNPALRMRLKEQRKPAHIYSDAEVLALVQACGREGEADIARAIITAWCVGQREGDILKFEKPRHYANGNFIFRQNKTGEYLLIPAPVELRPWLDTVPDGPLIGKSFKADWFRHLFARLRASAGIPDTAKFMHFRHSAVVRLARAGNKVPEIAAVTGHSIQTTQSIIDTYLPRDPIVARNAIKNLDRYNKKTRTTSPQPIDLHGPQTPVKVVQK